jgi:dihydroflavonol-4-reductase
MYATNVDGSANVIEAAAAAGVEKVVYTSSVATLGVNSDGTPADEETPVSVDDMIGHYKRSKYLAEAAVGARAGSRAGSCDD